MKKPVSSQPEASLDWMAAFKLYAVDRAMAALGPVAGHSRRND